MKRIASPFFTIVISMKQETLEELEKQTEKRAKARQKRKIRQMAVSGRSVFGLQRIIKRKAA
jgi:hypothetical protein